MNKFESTYRHEYKYVVSDYEITLLKSRIEKLMAKDKNVINGIYNISSIYFDDYDNNCYYDNEDGSDPREKFRIRIYNHSDSVIHLECKRKERGKTHKDSCSISKDDVETILNGKIPAIVKENNPLFNKLIIQMTIKRLRPVVIVEYERTPYVYKLGNVRITFDENLCSSSYIADFFKGGCPKRAVMPKGYHLMEVKFDEFLPDQIYQALQIENLQASNYSKYYLCRKYSVEGR